MLYFLTALPQPSFVCPVGSPGAQYAEQHRRPADGDAPASAADANSSFFTYDDEDSRCARRRLRPCGPLWCISPNNK